MRYSIAHHLIQPLRSILTSSPKSRMHFWFMRRTPVPHARENGTRKHHVLVWFWWVETTMIRVFLSDRRCSEASQLTDDLLLKYCCISPFNQCENKRTQKITATHEQSITQTKIAVGAKHTKYTRRTERHNIGGQPCELTMVTLNAFSTQYDTETTSPCGQWLKPKKPVQHYCLKTSKHLEFSCRSLAADMWYDLEIWRHTSHESVEFIHPEPSEVSMSQRQVDELFWGEESRRQTDIRLKHLHLSSFLL